MPAWVINELPRWIIFGAWLLINIALFTYQYWNFQATDQFYYMRLRTREALAMARAPALPINFNVIIILLPICRNLISKLRGTGRCPPRTIRRLLDKNLTFHKAIAWMLVVSSAIHVIAHWYNYERLLGLVTLPVLRARWPWETRFIPQDAQPAPDIVSDPITVCFITAAGVTGHVITVALFLMVTSSLEFIRRSYFEVFWYTHHLFIVFLLGLAFHQFQRLLPVQTNSPDRATGTIHDPVFCSQFADTNNLTLLGQIFGVTATNASRNDMTGAIGVTLANGTTFNVCPPATFRPAPPGSWMYMLGGLIIYIIERFVRFIRSFYNVVIIKVIEHPSNTIEIQMRQKGFFAEAGQYVFINVPSVAYFEWHPFTLTSAPEEDYFSVHIRVFGDWTEELVRQMGVGRKDFTQAWQLPKIAVDGPFGTASEDVFSHEVGLLVGAGIGVTPFASILKSIFYRKEAGDKSLCLEKVYFYWLCPSMHSFEWFRDLLINIERQLSGSDFLDVQVYLTRGWREEQAAAIRIREEDETDAITGFQAKTNYGRPDWPKIFDSMSLAHPNTDIGVFFCGPAVLSHNLHRYCNKYSKKSDETNRARFFYNKENF